ncbi:MAG: polyprenyl synthetase family protein [Bacteroidales bacterium]
MYTFEEVRKLVRKRILSLNLKGEPEELYAPIEYIISIGGKRIRPSLCILTYSLFENSIDEEIIDPAIALEIFHAFTLIHDDIMDNSDLRRGQLTIHKKWNKNIALLSGDVMSILSTKYLLHGPREKIPDIMELFSTTAAEVCEGQQFDMNYEKEAIIPIEDYINMIRLKTGVLIACSAKMGAILANQDKSICDALYNYGITLGLAFQITDDYLDVYGDSGTFGKPIGGDIVHNKKSWLAIQCLKKAKGETLEKYLNICKMSEEQADEKIKLTKIIYQELGIKEDAENEIDKYYLSAMETLSDTNLDEKKIIILDNFAKLIIKRKK